MADSFNWTCPACGRPTTVTSPNFANKATDVWCNATAEGMAIRVNATLIECPNQECKAQSFSVRALHGAIADSSGRSFVQPDPSRKVGIGIFTFLPTTAEPLSVHAPPHVREDYNEAYLIAILSPKASATLARRALQGMVRDFFALKDHRTLHAELEAIKEECDPALYEAMMAVKSIGNIGAHPERDINLIVDVEPGEPEALLRLIHLLDGEWYVARAERKARIDKMTALGQAKKIPPPAETAI